MEEPQNTETINIEDEEFHRANRVSRILCEDKETEEESEEHLQIKEKK